MFGYVLINKPELKIREFEKYRSYYCGLCHALNDEYGPLGRLTLNYDMTFLVMLLSDLYDEEDKTEYARCMLHPAHKHCSRRNEITDYCADMCILLTYYKCADDWNDEKKLSKKIWAQNLRRKCRRIAEKYPEKAELVKNKLLLLAETEKEEATHIDKTARIFGELMAEIFAYRDDEWKNDLYKVGFYLGKYVYLLDAYEDIEEDIKSGSYNPFKGIYANEDFEQQVLNLLLMMIGECTDDFERLPLVENVEILRNILYSGVWVRFGKTKAKNQKKNRKGKENQNESL